MHKIRTAVLIGGGSKLTAIYQGTQQAGSLAEIVLVVSFKRHSNGLDWAQAHGLTTHYLHWLDWKKQGKSRADFDATLVALLQAHQVELVVLAGWGLLLTTTFLEAYAGRSLNVHPALLTDTLQPEVTLTDGRTIPVFRGNHAIELALAAKVDTTGCTVHYVTAEMDIGKVILKKEVPIFPHDELESLAARVHAAEDEILPFAIELVCEQLNKIIP